MKGIGLVFSGGGGKGAYEVGVWKYLHDIGLDQYVKAVSGTSVGALNAALFIGNTYESAEKIWNNIEPSDILSPKKITVRDVTEWLINEGLEKVKKQSTIVGVAESAFFDMKDGMSHIARMIFNTITMDYYFSTDGLKNLIKKGIDINRLNNNDIPCFVTCLRYPGYKIDRFKLNDYEIRDVISILLASSAIPIIFPKEQFRGHLYCDGGVPILGDNVPIKPIYDMEIEYIIVIHLKQDNLINKDAYPNSKIIEIIPSLDLGNTLTGTIDFTSDGLIKRLELGYEDAKRILQPMIDMLYLNAEKQMILNTINNSNEKFQKRRKKLIQEEKQIMNEMKDDGFDKIYNELIGGT